MGIKLFHSLKQLYCEVFASSTFEPCLCYSHTSASTHVENLFERHVDTEMKYFLFESLLCLLIHSSAMNSTKQWSRKLLLWMETIRAVVWLSHRTAEKRLIFFCSFSNKIFGSLLKIQKTTGWNYNWIITMQSILN